MTGASSGIPGWANPVRYRFVKGLTLRQFIEEAERRADLPGNPEHKNLVKEIVTSTKGQAELTPHLRYRDGTRVKAVRHPEVDVWLSHTDFNGVRPLRGRDVSLMAGVSEWEGFSYLPAKTPEEQEVFVALNIGASTDEQILEDVKRLLPVIRRGVGVDEPVVDDMNLPASAIRNLANKSILLAMDLRVFSDCSWELIAEELNQNSRGLQDLVGQSMDRGYLNQLYIRAARSNTLDSLIYQP